MHELANAPAAMTITSACGQVLTLNVLRSELSCNGNFTAVKATPCRLLGLLVRHQAQIVSRATIYKEIWGYEFDPGTKIIEVQVYYLRAVLASLQSLFEIKTYRGRGISLQGPRPTLPS